jgi:ATP-dependent Clp protease ATP-binding subunit ClpA
MKLYSSFGVANIKTGKIEFLFIKALIISFLSLSFFLWNSYLCLKNSNVFSKSLLPEFIVSKIIGFMAILIDKTFVGFTLTFLDGDTLVRPALTTDIVRVNQDMQNLAKDFVNNFTEYNAERGRLLKLLSHFPDLEFKEDEIIFKKESMPQSDIPELELPFRIFYTELPENGLLGFEPVLGITSFGNDFPALKENLLSDIGLHFLMHQKGDSIQGIISTQWYKSVSCSLIKVNLETYNFTEIEELKNARKSQYLQRVAEEIKPQNRKVDFLEGEIETMERAMFGLFRQSILVTGKSGTGKSALIKAFLVKNRGNLSDGIYFQTNAAKMITGLMMGGLWFENLRAVCRELQQKQLVLYVENFADLFEVGQFEGNNQSIADLLKGYLKRGEITLITECTEAELANIELRSPGYAALFYTVKLTEKPPGQQIEIVYNHLERVARARRVSIDKQAVEEALKLQKRFMPYSGYPGKPIRFLEEILLEQTQERKGIDKAAVLDGFCNETGMPRFLIDQQMELDLEAMEKHFMERIHGQEAAVKTVTNVIATFKAFLSRTEKPVATLLFIGPTGVGKTEMAKVLAGYVFGSRTRFIRFDMSEFADPLSVLRLTGHGVSSSGLLTDAVRREPFSVVLFDELEKSHYTFYDLLLQILGEGRLADSRGEQVDFCSTIVIMTSNIGADTFGRGDLGFRKEGQNSSAAARHFEAEVQKYFRPELFNRIDQIVSFLPLDRKTIRHIVERELNEVNKREGLLSEENIITIKDEVLDFLGEKGYHPRYGARFLQRVIRKQLLVPLAKILNRGKNDTCLAIEIFVKNNSIAFDAVKRVKDKAMIDKTSKEVQVINLANKITGQRRFMMKIREGTSYVNILSRIAILKLKRKKHKKGEGYYFKDPMDEVELANLTELVERSNEVYDEIFRIERLGVRLMFNPDKNFDQVTQAFNSWKSKSHDMMLDIYNFSHIHHFNAVVGVYGPDEFIQDMIDLYMMLADWRGYSMEAQTVWLHKGRYYYQTGFELKYKGLLKAQFVGVELGVQGKAAYLYFMNEGGLHVIDKSSEKDHKYTVIVRMSTLKKFKTPENVFRKSTINQGKIRRMITRQACEDEKYLIRVKPDQFADKLKSYLDSKTLVSLISTITDNDEQD